MTPPTIILRHRKENLKKCSLSGLENLAGLQFFIYPKDPLPDLSSYVMLAVGAPPLTKEDAHQGLLIIDATWRLAERMQRKCPLMPTRSLPQGFCTAYPRRQTDCIDPASGLASVEALYIAHFILGRCVAGFLDRYHWRDEFLRLNNLNT